MVRCALILSLLTACSPEPTQAEPSNAPLAKNAQVATFAGGCFWCMETAFEGMSGVHTVVSGYMGGPELNPTYKDVAQGRTGHAEVVQVTYDPKLVSYEILLTTFWFNVDPFMLNQQFCDRGTQYRSGIFFHGDDQKAAAVSSAIRAKHKTKLSGAFQVEITEASTFYPAEDYHQDYYLKNPSHYKRYRNGCGRDRRLKAIWGSSQSGVEIQKKHHTK